MTVRVEDPFAFGNGSWEIVDGVVTDDYDPEDTDTFWSALDTVLKSAKAQGIRLPDYVDDEYKIKRSGWLGEELNDKPCTYGIPKDPAGDPRDTKQCGKPSVYKAVGGFEFCQEHAPEVAENDEVYLPA